MTASVIRAHAASLPLPDASVDLIVTSPPFYALRSYTDGGVHYAGQVGSEPTWQEYIENLLDCTREWIRVLKPEGNLFVELGDVYSTGPKGRSPDYAGVKGRGVHRPGGQSEWTQATAAWLAAVLDCEGSVSGRIFTNGDGGESFVVWMRVTMMDSEVVQRIHEITGVGRVFQDKRGAWTWNAASQAARYVLERIWPWLVIKQKRALAAIELCRHVEARAARGRRKLTADDLTYRAQIVQAIRDWNGHPSRSNDYEPPAPPKILLPHVAPSRIPPKCLMDLPYRYAIRCVDDLGLIKRAEIPWHHVNGLPESVTDRVQRAHSMVFHFTRQPRYYSAVDEIREPQTGCKTSRSSPEFVTRDSNDGLRHRTMRVDPSRLNPLGKLPGSVWNIPSQPLQVPEHVGVDHFAAFPMELPRRVILGWSPPGVCTACGQGRRPIVASEFRMLRTPQANNRRRMTLDDDGLRGEANHYGGPVRIPGQNLATITGYACACPQPSAPTRPARVLDPFGGTGTTALVASVLGRHGITADLSADYCRLAAWRTTDPGERARTMQAPKPPPIPDGQEALFTL